MCDPFLNRTSAEMKTCTESVISYDLGMPFDYEGVLSENIVKENYESFLRICHSNFESIEIDDIVEDIQAAIYAYLESYQYVVLSNKFTLKTLSYDGSKKAKWDAINISCALYLGLTPEIDETLYSLKLELN